MSITMLVKTKNITYYCDSTSINVIDSACECTSKNISLISLDIILNSDSTFVNVIDSACDST